MAAQRGMREDDYCEWYPYRILAVHATAYFKDKFLLLTALFGSGSDTPKSSSGAGTPFAKAGEAAAGKQQLYSWFRRKPGRVYNVVSSEAPISQFRGVVKEWTGGPR